MTLCRAQKYDDAVALVIRTQQASIARLQCHLQVGYNRAARMLGMMENDGIVGPAKWSEPREVLVGTPKESAPAMSTCYQCGRAIHGQGSRREVYTGHSTGMYFGRRVSGSFRSHYGMRTLCAACAEAHDKRGYVGIGIVAVCIILGLISSLVRSSPSTNPAAPRSAVSIEKYPLDSTATPTSTKAQQRVAQLRQRQAEQERAEQAAARRPKTPPQLIQPTRAPEVEFPEMVVHQYYADLNRHDVEAARGKWKTPPPRLQDMVQQVDWYRVENITLIKEEPSAAQVEVVVIGKRLNQQPEQWHGTIALAQLAGTWKLVKMNLTKQ